jgi:acyl carrier protein
MSSVCSREGFLDLLRDHLDMDVSEPQLSEELSQLPVWDSVYLLRMVTVLEETTGGRVPVRALLEARTLEEMRLLVSAAAVRHAGGGR